MYLPVPKIAKRSKTQGCGRTHGGWAIYRWGGYGQRASETGEEYLQTEFAAHSQRGQLLQMTIKFESIIVLGSLATTHDLSFAQQI